MVTSRMAWSALLLAACSGNNVAVLEPSNAPPSSQPALPPDTVEVGGSGPAYPGHGFRVHEWGTNTIVVGTDGSVLRGLHHEEEDLPPFVYDRTRAEVARDPQTEVKMETPVTYFYSDVPLRAKVTVGFPTGIFTQWYPREVGYFPPVVKGVGDPALDASYPFSTAACRTKYGSLTNGFLDWGDVDVLPRGADARGPDASLDKYTWSHARAVDANPIRVGAQAERFLFYRGVGNYPLRMNVRTGADGVLDLTNVGPHKIGAVFVLRVEGGKAAFKVHPAGLVAKDDIREAAPAATQPLDAYAQDLATSMVAELDKAGLYHDESIGMVKTWARQWFRTPGVRVLYLAPREWTDEQIPLAIVPAPVEKVRVMVIRVEALTPEQESIDLSFAKKLGAEPAADAHFASLGRFAEPRLRRALAQVSSPPAAATSYLERIARANASVRAGE